MSHNVPHVAGDSATGSCIGFRKCSKAGTSPQKPNALAQPICFGCGYFGHTAKICPNPHRPLPKDDRERCGERVRAASGLGARLSVAKVGQPAIAAAAEIDARGPQDDSGVLCWTNGRRTDNRDRPTEDKNDRWLVSVHGGGDEALEGITAA